MYINLHISLTVIILQQCWIQQPAQTQQVSEWKNVDDTSNGKLEGGRGGGMVSYFMIQIMIV